jgi:hypothetical protein
MATKQTSAAKPPARSLSAPCGVCAKIPVDRAFPAALSGARKNGSGSRSISRDVKGRLGWRLSLNRFLCIAAGTIAGFPRDSWRLGQSRRESAVRRKQIKFQSESLTAALCLGVAIAGVSTLIGIGLIIVFA